MEFGRRNLFFSEFSNRSSMPDIEFSQAVQSAANDVLVWVGFGTLVGLLAKAIMPGRDPGGTVATLMMGIGGTVIGSASCLTSPMANAFRRSARWASSSAPPARFCSYSSTACWAATSSAKASRAAPSGSPAVLPPPLAHERSIRRVNASHFSSAYFQRSCGALDPAIHR